MKGILQHYSVLTYELIGNVRLTLLEAPKASGAPANPLNARTVVIKTMLVALAVGIIFLAMLSTMRDTIRNSRDVEGKLDTKLLASIHREKSQSPVTCPLQEG